MALFDDASLVVTPNGYKAGTLYSIKPTSGLGDMAVVRATTATRVNSAGLIESVANNVPRLDYSNGSCPSLLVEPQRTNLLEYSEQFNNAYWEKANVTVTANTTISPDGTQNADTVVSTGVSSEHRVRANTSMAINTEHTVSIYAKKTNTRYAYIRDLTNNIAAVYDLQDGVVSLAAGTSTSITAVGSFYRISMTFVTPSVIINNLIDIGLTIDPVNLSSLVPINDTIVFWGAQLEVGSYPTSYIPTTSAAVTRNDDVISKTGISSLIGVNGGSIFVEVDANGLNGGGVGNYIFDLSDNTNFDQNRIAMYWTGVNDLSIFYAYGGAYASVTYTFNFLTTKKVAVRWTSTQIQAVIDGVAQTAVTYGNSSPSKLNLASRFNNVEFLSSAIKVCVLFNTTQTTADLISLTT